MATKTQTSPSVFPRIRFGFGPKSSSSRIRRLPPDPQQNPDDADWYIPYNGPYELPPSVPRSQDRDSWGQVIGSVLDDLGSTTTSPMDRRIAFPLPSSGEYSSHPYRTSSATDDAPTGTYRGGGMRPIITPSSTAFAHIDTTGGVGEFPARSPLQTSPLSGSGSAHRLSLANLLSFGGTSTRKSRSDSLHSSQRPLMKRSRNGSTPTPSDPLQSNHLPPRSHSLAHGGPSTHHAPRQRSNTLIGTYRSPPAPASSRKPSTSSSQHRDSPLSTHPYAYANPPSHSGAPRRAPIVSPPPLTQSHSLDKGKSIDRSYQYPQPPSTDTLNVAEVPPHLRPTSRTSLLKTISAPNLRNLSRGLSLRKPTPSSRGKSRWLSPETWCDALLFPRPRFLEHIDGEPMQPVSQRNVSIPAPKAHTLPGRERMPLGRSWLRASRSAVNLHVTDSSSRGPPRAEPMLMPKPSVDGWSSSSRPRSFAQDDLAIPSPVPSIVRVLEMGASFDRERATWRSTAERSFQSSKLTRSLGRSRSQSAGRTRAQLKDMGGVGFLATKTLLGNQLAAPTVGTPTSSEGTQTQHTRSGTTSHARTTSSGTHSRAGSKGKIAVMRAATGLCISGEKTQDAVISRYDNIPKASIEVQHLVPPQPTSLSPSPVAMDSATVGIAFCSPLPSAEELVASPVLQQPATKPRDHHHLYAAVSAVRRSHTHTRSNSDYAGPHPSAVAVTPSASALASDMSARHRLPPQAALHPYPYQHPHPYATTTSSSAPPSATTAAHPLQPPLPAPRPRGGRPRPQQHAYAAAGSTAGDDRFSAGPLVFADALSYGLQRRFSADSGLGESEGHHHQQQQQELLAPFPDVTRSSSTFLSLHSSRHTVASSPVFLAAAAAASPASASHELRRSAQTSSAEPPGSGSRASSPLQSPRPFGTIEDLDRYRNLFYSPKSGTTAHRRTLSHDTATSELTGGGGSGLAALTRQLNNEFGATTDGAGAQRRWWMRGTMSDVYSDDPDAVLLPLSMHRSHQSHHRPSTSDGYPQDVESHISSVLERSEDMDEMLRLRTVGVASTPLATTSAHRLSFVCDVHRGSTQESHALPPPEHDDEYEYDRASASSTYTADATDNDDDDDIDIDIDMDDDDEYTDDEEGEGDSTLPPLLVVSALRGSQMLEPSAPPHSALTRSSYMTNDTATASCISGLSDFPVPPTQTVVHEDVLKSYFGGDDDEARAGPSQASR